MGYPYPLLTLVPENVAGISHAYSPIQAAISLFMDGCDQVPHILPKMQNKKSSTLRWHSFPRWGGERCAFSFPYKGGQYFVYDCVRPVAHRITLDTCPTIVYTPLTLIFRLWQGASLCPLWSLRRPINQKQTVTYRCQYFAINSNTSECDHAWWIPTGRAGDWNRQVYPNLVTPAGWRVLVWVWPTKC